MTFAAVLYSVPEARYFNNPTLAVWVDDAWEGRRVEDTQQLIE